MPDVSGASGQWPASPATTAVLSGVVIDAATHQPVADAVVSVDVPGSVRSAVQPSGRVLTDAAGRWLLEDVPPGTAFVNAVASGFLSGGFGERTPDGSSQALLVRDADRRRDVTIALFRAASISGVVLDDEGDPVVNTHVMAFRRLGVGSGFRLVSIPSALTDDRGAYRLGQLVPGDYVVGVGRQMVTAATQSVADTHRQLLLDHPDQADSMRRELTGSGVYNPSAPGMRVPGAIIQSGTLAEFDLMPPPPEDGRLLIYQRSFFRTAAGVSHADVLHVESGEDRTSVDLRLRLVKTTTVSGTVNGPDGPVRLVGVHLTSSGADAIRDSTGYDLPLDEADTDAEGAFVFPAVAPGTYDVEVLKTMGTGPSGSTVWWAGTTIVVGDRPVGDLALTMRLGLRATGRVVFHSVDGTKTPASVAVALSPKDVRVTGFASAFPPTTCGPDGAFTTAAYPSGTYWLSATATGGAWSVESIRQGDRDLALEALALDEHDAADVVITMTDHPTTITGTVRASSGSADADATVVIFPTDYAAWMRSGLSARVSATTRVDAAGVFRIRNLPPGDYIVTATDHLDDDWQETASVVSLVRSGVRVTLGSGDARSLDLRGGSE